jgi:prepilin-type N-terminal cleavage/methylation domain-containing protein
MKTLKQNRGFTLIEMVVVMAIIVILISMVLGVAKRIDDQGKIRLCRDTLAIIDNALEQFRDFGYEYRNGFSGQGLAFPLDCNNFNAPDLTGTIQVSLNLPLLSVAINPADPCQLDNSGSEALYFFLSQVPDCRTTLDKIDKSLVTDNVKGTTTTKTITFASSSQTLPFMRVIDPWKMPLRYDYYGKLPLSIFPDLAAKRTFPVITSAGPDKKFDTSDDIINRQSK